MRQTDVSRGKRNARARRGAKTRQQKIAEATRQTLEGKPHIDECKCLLCRMPPEKKRRGSAFLDFQMLGDPIKAAGDTISGSKREITLTLDFKPENPASILDGVHGTWKREDAKDGTLCMAFIPDPKPEPKPMLDKDRPAWDPTKPLESVDISKYVTSLNRPSLGATGETINHPAHYGGDTTYEHVKVMEAWGLMTNAMLYNTTKYLCRAGKKGSALQDLEKAAWYLQREIDRLKKEERK